MAKYLLNYKPPEAVEYEDGGPRADPVVTHGRDKVRCPVGQSHASAISRPLRGTSGVARGPHGGRGDVLGKPVKPGYGSAEGRPCSRAIPTEPVDEDHIEERREPRRRRPRSEEHTS